MLRRMISSVALALAAALLAGCSTISSTVKDGAEIVGVPQSCVSVYESGEAMLDLVLDLQDEALKESDTLFELSEAISAMDVDRVEQIMIGVAEKSQGLDTSTVRTMIEDYRVAVADCRAS